jgi:CTP:molybdopterin cytidylyltransferase MocA
MADGSTGGRIFGFLLFSTCAVLSYQAWQNGHLSSATEALAKQHACDADPSCIVLDDRPRVGKADVIRHRYEFMTSMGIMTVTCKREMVLFGTWTCTPAEGRLDPGV